MDSIQGPGRPDDPGRAGRDGAAAGPPLRVAFDHGGFWIGSRDVGPAYVPVTPPAGLTEDDWKALRAW